MLPESMFGDAFLKKYTDHHDPVTVIDKTRNYGVRAAARHPIYENFRVQVNSNLKHSYRLTDTLYIGIFLN